METITELEFPVAIKPGLGKRAKIAEVSTGFFVSQVRFTSQLLFPEVIVQEDGLENEPDGRIGGGGEGGLNG